MPTPIHFEGVNCTHTHPDCYDLPTMVLEVPFGETKVNQVTACYQFSKAELDDLRTNGGLFYVSTIGGWPPLSVSLKKPEATVTMVEFADIASRLKQELDSVRIVNHGNEGRVYLTFPDLQFDLSKDEWEYVQNLFADL